MATTLGSDEAGVYYPAVSRWIELGFVGGHPRLHCDRLNVRRVERRISFPEPEKGRIYRSLGDLPYVFNAYMILKVLSHSWKMLYQGYTEALQISLVTNSGLHQYLRRMDCTQRQNHLSTDSDAVDITLANNFHARCPRGPKTGVG